MVQSKKHSLLETCCQTGTGFLVAFLLNYFCLPWFGYHPDVLQSIWMTLLFCSASIVRGYYLRRLFNWLHAREML